MLPDAHGSLCRNCKCDHAFCMISFYITNIVKIVLNVHGIITMLSKNENLGVVEACCSC